MAFALIIHALASCCLYANRFGHHDADSLIRISAVKQGHASAKIDPDNATAFTVLSEAQLQNVKLGSSTSWATSRSARLVPSFC